MSFSSQVNTWVIGKAGSNANPKRVRDGVLLKLFGAVIKSTPVAEGRARGAWNTGINNVSLDNQANAPKGQAPLRRSAEKLRPSEMEDTIYFSNNLPYISALEFGEYPGVGPKTVQGAGGIYSKQAPSGMVRQNIARFSNLIAREAARVNK